MMKFWDWIRDEDGSRVLRLEGPIDADDFWGDTVTPQAFREELMAEDGDLTLWINSPGGSVWAASEIYTMIRDYPGKVTVKIDAIAASAASVVAMAGERVLMSPVSMIMVHDPMTVAMGNTKDMEKAIEILNEVKESIMNAYVAKTGLRRSKIAELMENETWMNARKAVELGFADEILFDEKKSKKTDESETEPEEDDPEQEEEKEESEEDDDDEEDDKKPKKGVTLRQPDLVWQFSGRIMSETILNRLGCVSSEMDTPVQKDPMSVNEELEPDYPEDTLPVDTEDMVTEDVSEEDPTDDTQTVRSMPTIGMDGKTEDGAMPYQLLREKLEWLK